ncbi:DUF2129 domain-containing protein, partial [Metabacillus niabensis]|uniref:DUF2129 domain-containing protein n=1 Tax=Metabacillus niabensis TaxID=324854 RepID=UPI001582DB2E
MFEKRQGIVVWLHSLKHVKMLRKFGNVHYVSKRLKYVVLYCNIDVVEQTLQKLSTYSFVKLADPSYKPFLKL